MKELMSGALVMGYLVAGLFFLRFWRRSKDQLFLWFAIAFWVFAGQRLALSLTAERLEHDLVFYVFRLLGFALILGAILQKNRNSR